MAEIPMLDTTYNCGCGFRCKTWPEARKHIALTRHVISIHGTARMRRVKGAVGKWTGKQKSGETSNI